MNSTSVTPVVAPAVDLNSILQNTLLQSLSSVLANALNGSANQAKTSNESTTNLSSVTVSSPETNGSIPEYRPTPIAELERRRRVQHTPISQPVVIKEGNVFNTIKKKYIDQLIFHLFRSI